MKNGEITNHYIDHVIETLVEIRKILSNNTLEHGKLSVDVLQMIAKTRICLSACANILSTNTWKLVNCDVLTKQKLVANLGLLIKEFRNSDMHMFFHRQVIFKYSRQELLTITNEHEWLTLEKDKDREKVPTCFYCFNLLYNTTTFFIITYFNKGNYLL